MTDRLNAEIDAIFAAQEEADQERIRDAEEKKRVAAKLADELVAARDTVVRPAFEEFRTLLLSRGFDCKVIDEPARGAPRPRLTFYLVKSGEQPNGRTACLAVDFDPSTGRVEFRRTAGHHSGEPVGTINAAEVRTELVHEKLLDLLRKAVK